MTKNTLFLLAFATTLITMGAGCATQVSVNPTDNTPSSTAVVATSTNPYAVGTLTYRNDTYGFAFPYPADTGVMENKHGRWSASGGVDFYIGNPDENGKAGSGVSVKANTNNQTLQQAFDENYNKYKTDITSPGGSEWQLKDLYVSDIKVDGHDAKELYIDHFGDSDSTMVSVVNNGYIYLISGGDKKGDLDKFLSTFKFTDSINNNQF